MRTIEHIIIILALAAISAGCATSTRYQPAPEADDYGYRDVSLTSERYRVSFTGNDLTARETVENYALYRAAEIALAAGYDRFKLVERETETTSSYASVGTGIGGFGIGHGHFGGGPFFGTSIGVVNSEPSTSYRTVAEILVGPEVRSGDADVYNARELKSRLEERVVRPEG